MYMYVNGTQCQLVKYISREKFVNIQFVFTFVVIYRFYFVR